MNYLAYDCQCTIVLLCVDRFKMHQIPLYIPDLAHDPHFPVLCCSGPKEHPAVEVPVRGAAPLADPHPVGRRARGHLQVRGHD